MPFPGCLPFEVLSRHRVQRRLALAAEQIESGAGFNYELTANDKSNYIAASHLRDVVMWNGVTTSVPLCRFTHPLCSLCVVC